MGTARRILLILAAVVLTALYWCVAWLHFVALTYCHGRPEFCEPGRAQRTAEMNDAAIAYGIGYALIVAACSALIRWRAKRK